MSAGPWRLDGSATTLLLDAGAEGILRLLRFGRPLPEGAGLPAALVDALRPRTAPQIPRRREVFPGWGFGFTGEPALLGHRSGTDVATDFALAEVRSERNGLRLRLRDGTAGLAVELAFDVDPATDVWRVRTTLVNEADEPFALAQLAAATLPLPRRFAEVLTLHGRWGGEFRPVRRGFGAGAIVVESRVGRTGHGSQPTLVVGTGGFGEEAGEVLGLHLAWSGDHRLVVETLPDGEGRVWLGERLSPGEIVLGPGEAHEAPPVLFAWSDTGLGGLSDRFHRYLVGRHLPRRLRARPRPVHLNTWEAVYHRHRPAELLEIAEAAAALGVERFVLDDGWFEDRDDDRTSLGDWRVDRRKYPDGLRPLADRVRALGMEFGLWVEPEMVSPQSALYREHPDWCLHVPGSARPLQRHQLVLDLTREEVREYLFAALDGLVRDLGIAYLKWDHNRDLFPATSAGRPAVRRQTLAFYALLDRLRAAHPDLEIESCAAGGGRVDLGVLARTERFWASDSNDALERVAIQRGASLLYPLGIIGTHVGPRVCHLTGRTLPMLFRARVAMFGHMGLELDPRELDEEERGILAGHIALYKRFRALLHSGRLHRIDLDEGASAQLVVATDASEALLLAVTTTQAPFATRPPVRLPGLDPEGRYRLRLVEPWPEPAGRELADPEFWRGEPAVAGAVLADAGLSLPLAWPETAWLVHLERTG